MAFKLDLGNDPLAFFMLTIAMVATAASIGLAASTTRLRGSGLAAILIIAALLGGCMFPLDLMPSFLRTASYLVPHSWALNGYQNLMVRGQGLQEVFLQILVLLAFAALFFWIALRRFNFEKE
ncbi:MAG: ABC transporter permease [Chloroflexi bacterium]|nr:MAG: ABC transporter permease [Chloroflexota bacterium]